MNELPVTISMEPAERDLILKEGLPSAELARNLRFGLHEGKFLVFRLPCEVAEELAEVVAAGANHASNQKNRRKLGRLSDKIEQALSDDSGEEPDSPPFPRSMPMDVRKEIEALMGSPDFDSIEKANRKLQEINDKHNRNPQPELQGLSPEQVRRLLYLDWEHPDFPIQLRNDLPLETLDKSELLHNARVFLDDLEDSGPTRATAAGNLNRKFVLRMVETMRWPKGLKEERWFRNKVLNEEDALHLHVLRIVLGASGLIRKAKGTFRITKKGVKCLNERQAGSLFALLFDCFFRKFNLAYLDRMEDYPGIQQTIPYSLCILARKARNWRNPDELAQEVFLPAVARDFRENVYFDDASILILTRILQPLERFGLVTCKYEKGKSIFRNLKQVRTSTLFHDFLQFNLDTT